MLAGFDTDVTAQIPHRAMVEMDPDHGTTHMFEGSRQPEADRAPRVHGPR